MQKICTMLGGSHAYGLVTPESDEDLRGVFLNDTLSQAIGMDLGGPHALMTVDMNIDSPDTIDEVYYEARHFLRLLQKSNTTAFELLFNEKWIIHSDEWYLIQSNRENLLSSEKFYKSLKGYIQSELRLANGERTGLLGGKRKAALDQYGFSPKNFVQLLRLCYAGAVFFEDDYFPVNIAEDSPGTAHLLMNIKRHPEQWTKEKLNELVADWEKVLDEKYAARKNSFLFDHTIANEILLKLYAPIIDKLNRENRFNVVPLIHEGSQSATPA